MILIKTTQPGPEVTATPAASAPSGTNSPPPAGNAPETPPGPAS